MSRLRLLRDEGGFSMVFTLLTLLVTTVTMTAAIQYTTSNSSSANRSEADQIAYALAEAGLANGAAVLSKPENNALQQSTLPSTEPTTDSNYILAYEGGTVKFWGVLTGHQWIMHGVGIVTDPTGKTAPVRREATSTIKIQPTLKQTLNSNAWNYMFAKSTNAGNGCDVTLDNTVTVDTSLFVLGGLCLDSSSSIVKATDPDKTALVVGETVQFLGTQTNVGTSAARIEEAHIAGGCRIGSSDAFTNPCTTGTRVWANTLDNATVVNDGGPVADFAFWYANAKPGPTQNCSSQNGSPAGTPPVFEAAGSTTISPPAGPYSSGTFNLTPSSSYTCRYYDIAPADQDILGELSWVASTKTLTVKGVVFIDGSAIVSNNAVNKYVGLGTLYLAGTFVISGTSQLCGGIAAGNCDFAAWDPNSAMLGIVANGRGASDDWGVRLTNSARFQGSIYADRNVELQNSTQFDGPIVANSFSLGNSVQTHEFPTITSVPVGWPGNRTVYLEPQPPQNYSG